MHSLLQSFKRLPLEYHCTFFHTTDVTDSLVFHKAVAFSRKLQKNYRSLIMTPSLVLTAFECWLFCNCYYICKRTPGKRNHQRLPAVLRLILLIIIVKLLMSGKNPIMQQSNSNTSPVDVVYQKSIRCCHLNDKKLPHEGVKPAPRANSSIHITISETALLL